MAISPRHRTFTLGLILTLSNLLGCGGKNTHGVSGVILLEGQPLPAAEITFMLADGSGRPADAVSDENGRFTLATFGKKDGALAGEYKVLVRKFSNTLHENETINFAELAAESKRLRAAAKKKVDDDRRRARQNNEVFVEPEPVPDNKSVLHENYSNFAKTPITITVPAKSIKLLLNKEGT